MILSFYPLLILFCHFALALPAPQTTGDVIVSPAPNLASDGAGSGFSITAILWIVFCIIVGLPLTFAGIRIPRIISSIGLGLAISTATWLAIVNSMGQSTLPDIAITLITFGAWAFGTVVGWFVPQYGIGDALLAITGGISIGIRVVLLRPGILVPILAVDWVICGILGVGLMVFLVFRRRTATIIASVSSGTFLAFLAIDLVINKQAGMSSGIRVLFDKNMFHAASIKRLGYSPPMLTFVVIGISLGSIPLLSYMQHRLFSTSLVRVRDSIQMMGTLQDSTLLPSWPRESPNYKPRPARSRFSL